MINEWATRQDFFKREPREVATLDDLLSELSEWNIFLSRNFERRLNAANIDEEIDCWIKSSNLIKDDINEIAYYNFANDEEALFCRVMLSIEMYLFAVEVRDFMQMELGVGVNLKLETFIGRQRHAITTCIHEYGIALVGESLEISELERRKNDALRMIHAQYIYMPTYPEDQSLVIAKNLAETEIRAYFDPLISNLHAQSFAAWLKEFFDIAKFRRNELAKYLDVQTPNNHTQETKAQKVMRFFKRGRK